jgi:nucleotide-binding universal stress UspA family protein
MFKNVLVGVDGKEHGRDAIALARRLSDPGAKVTLVHVHPGEHNRLRAIRTSKLEQESASSTELLEAERSLAGVDAAIVSVVAESPGAGLHKQADEAGADLIVVGSTSRSVIGRVTLGDDTRAALNGSPCAVAIASRGYCEHAEPIATVGVGYNEYPEAQYALQTARTIAEPTGASVSLLEVIAIPSYSYAGMLAPVGEGIDVMLEDATKRIQEIPDVQGRVVFGLTGEELAAFGENVDILLVGSRSYGPLRRLVVGSTSEYLERHARCSLLVLPRSAMPAEQDDEGEGAQAPASTAT